MRPASALGEPTPTAALLWAACRPSVDRGAVADALARGPDLNVAAGLAVAQRIAPLVLRAVTEARRDAPTGAEVSWLAPLRADAARCRAQAALLLPALAHLALEPLGEAGFQPLVLKGAALRDRYEDPGLRPMDDVDVLLAAPEIPSALDVLDKNGWIRRHALDSHHHEVLLTHPDLPGLPLELHAGLATRRERSNRLSERDLLNRRTPRTIGGVDAFGLAPEDELVLLASHAAKPFHTFRRLLWSVDIAVVIRAQDSSGGIDWDAVAHLARRSASRTALAVALAHAARLGASSPDTLRRIPARGTRRAALEPLLSPDWPIVAGTVSRRAQLKYALIDDPRLWFALLGASIAGEGFTKSFGHAARTGSSIVGLWRRLRSSGQQLLEDPGHAVQP